MHHDKNSWRRYAIAGFILIFGCSIAAISAAHFNGKEARAVAKAGNSSENIATVSPSQHETIKASVLSDNPSAYKIDVKKMANMGVNEEAPTFAVYITDSVPSTCGDFRDLKLPYKKPSKYEREFNLSEHKEVLSALDQYGCVVMKNIPPAG